MPETTTVRVLRDVQRKLASMCKLRGVTVQAAATEALQDKIEQWQHGGVFFYCTRCGKRMWPDADPDVIGRQTVDSLLAGLVCSDCLLAESPAVPPRSPPMNEWAV